MTLAAFGNTTSYGGGMLICPTADPCDGLLDITVIGKAGRLKAASNVNDENEISPCRTHAPSSEGNRKRKQENHRGV